MSGETKTVTNSKTKQIKVYLYKKGYGRKEKNVIVTLFFLLETYCLWLETLIFFCIINNNHLNKRGEGNFK